MKKSLALILASIIVISTVFAACAGKDEDKKTTSTSGDNPNLTIANNEYGTEKIDGKEEDVVYETTDGGKTIAYVIDNNGEKVTKANGDYVSTSIKDTTTSATKKGETTSKANSNNTNVPTEQASTTRSTTGTTKKNVSTTSNELTTLDSKKDNVPLTSATGTEVTFSTSDQERIASMLETPGLTSASYENENGVPAKIAVHAAIWMVQKNSNNSTTYPSGTVVLDLFKFFGQTAVNFKKNCNDAADSEGAPIKYNSKDDTFTVSKAEGKEQTVNITKIESLGNNNYYKVTAKVSNSSKTKVVAIIQKNKLDTSIGFSIKALKWS